MTDPTSSRPAQHAEFEPEFIDGLKTLFEEKITFNQVLGLKITLLTPERVVARIMMTDQLVGHYAHHRIHGGVISAGLDTMGGLAVMAAIGARHMDESPLQRLQRFSKLGTKFVKSQIKVTNCGFSDNVTAVNRHQGDVIEQSN